MTRRRLPGDAKDAQSRYIEAAVNVRPRLKVAGVDRAVRGKPDPSDHAPAWIVLK